MEEMRDYREYRNDDDDWHIPDDEKNDLSARSDDDVPFHIPRD